tara:strand:+ start:182 stop:484 length:303 start_codon:yes stop_codon:yes gene_type:complete
MGLLERADEVYEMYRDDGHLWGVPHTREIDLPKYKQNLKVRKEYMGADGWRIVVKSYDTDVAVGWEDSSELLVTNWYSRTTTKHINYVARELDMYVKKLY